LRRHRRRLGPRLEAAGGRHRPVGQSASSAEPAHDGGHRSAEVLVVIGADRTEDAREPGGKLHGVVFTEGFVLGLLVWPALRLFPAYQPQVS
jgi:hypothetical protein